MLWSSEPKEKVRASWTPSFMSRLLTMNVMWPAALSPSLITSSLITMHKSLSLSQNKTSFNELLLFEILYCNEKSNWYTMSVTQFQFRNYLLCPLSIQKSFGCGHGPCFNGLPWYLLPQAMVFLCIYVFSPPTISEASKELRFCDLPSTCMKTSIENIFIRPEMVVHTFNPSTISDWWISINLKPTWSI